MYKLTAIIILVVTGLPANGQSVSPSSLGMVEQDLPRGLLRGELVPDFNGRTCAGNQLQLSTMFEDGPVVLVFYRGGWSEECVAHLQQVQDSLDLLEDLDLQLIAITPEAQEHACNLQATHALRFPVFPDEGGRLMRDFDVDYKVTTSYWQQIMSEKGVNIARQNGAEAAILPVTATYIISPNQEVFWRHFTYDLSKRAGVQTILNAISPKQ